MPIEESITELTRAIDALTAAVLKTIPQGIADVANAIPRGTETREVKKLAAAKTEKPADTPSTAAEPAAPETKAEPSGTLTPVAIDFATQIQKPIVSLAATGKRDAALAILKELGAARASDIKPEDYPRAVELIGQVK